MANTKPRSRATHGKRALLDRDQPGVASQHPMSPQNSSDGVVTKQRLSQAVRLRWLRTARADQLPPEGDWFIWFIRSGRGWGKGVPLPTPIATPSGWTTIGDIQDGDELFDEQGRVCRVVKGHPVRHLACYKLTFDDGSTIVADADHLWQTQTNAERKRQRRQRGLPSDWSGVRSTKELYETQHQNNARMDANHSIDNAKPLQMPEADLPIHPYVLGYWLGDGSSQSLTFSFGDEDAQESKARIESLLGVHFDRRDDTRCFYKAEIGCERAIEIRKIMRDDLGLMRGRPKSVPPMYLRASVRQRRELLAGMLDSDGSVEAHDNRVSYGSMIPELADAVFELAASLGFKPRRSIKRAVLHEGGYTKDCGESHRVRFTPTTQVFRLKRKADRLDFTKTQQSRHNKRMISRVEEVDSVPTRCLTVDSPSRLFLVGEQMVPTHNTRTGAEYSIEHCRQLGADARFMLVGQTYSDMRDVMVEGESGILSLLPPSLLKEGSVEKAWNRSLGQLTLENGARMDGYGAEKPRKLRGPQSTGAWGDEPATWADADLGMKEDTTLSNLMFGCRLGPDPRIVLTGTPRANPLIKELVTDSRVVVTRGSTYDNLSNLAPSFRKQVVEAYEGTRLGRQELHGEILDIVDGALWTPQLIDDTRVSWGTFSDMIDVDRVCVAIDPATRTASANKRTARDETGIQVVARGDAPPGKRYDDVRHLPHAYLIDDLSGRMTPRKWAREAADARIKYHAEAVVGEVNNGGDLVEVNLRTVDPDSPVRQVWASRGKAARAEEVQALHEQGRVHVVGYLSKTEDEMTTWTAESRWSPNRLDALVWGVWEQILRNNKAKSSNVPDRRASGRR